jgi:hypothetical protein
MVAVAAINTLLSGVRDSEGRSAQAVRPTLNTPTLIESVNLVSRCGIVDNIRKLLVVLFLRLGDIKPPVSEPIALIQRIVSLWAVFAPKGLMPRLLIIAQIANGRVAGLIGEIPNGNIVRA